MKSGRGVLLAAAWLMAFGAHAGEFRKIGDFDGTSRDAYCRLEDWDGDGDLELVHTDRVEQIALSHASHNLYLAQVYETLSGQWVLRTAFIFRSTANLGGGGIETDGEPETQPFLHRGDKESKGDAVRELTGDFNSDGVPDLLVAETKDGLGESSVLRLKQENKTVFEELLLDIDVTGPNFQKLQTVDFDKDGESEVLVWLSNGGWGTPYAYIYGTPNSQWRAPDPLRVPLYLGEALGYLKGVRAAAPEAQAPVSAKISAASPVKLPPHGEFTDEPTYRFRIEFSAIDGGGVTNPALWRDYFMKWGIGYVQAIEEPDVEQVREMRMSASGDNALEFETEFPRDRDSIRPGEYELWMECPYVERAPNAFGWSGTLITPRIEVKIENAWPKVEAE